MIEFELLIGKEVVVKTATNASLIGIQGKIVNETLNTIVVETCNGCKTVVKDTSKFLINGIEVCGREIAKRPFERLKQKWKK